MDGKTTEIPFLNLCFLFNVSTKERNGKPMLLKFDSGVKAYLKDMGFGFEHIQRIDLEHIDLNKSISKRNGYTY